MNKFKNGVFQKPGNIIISLFLSNFLLFLQNFSIWIFVCAWAASVQGYKILFLVPINGKSHWNYMRVFVKELLYRGHEVTCVTSITMGDSKLQNYTEILIDPPFDMQNLSE